MFLSSFYNTLMSYFSNRKIHLSDTIRSQIFFCYVHKTCLINKHAEIAEQPLKLILLSYMHVPLLCCMHNFSYASEND